MGIRSIGARSARLRLVMRILIIVMSVMHVLRDLIIIAYSLANV